jgi:hypothetical protein
MKTNQRTLTMAGSIQGGKKRDGLKRVVLSGMMALTLIGSAGFIGAAGHAEARVNGPRLDSLSFQCGQLQDRRDAIWAEYSGASPARQAQLMDELRGIMQNWTSICQGTFGAIGVRMAPETTGVAVTDITEVSDSPTSSPVKPLLPVSKLPRSSLFAD